MQTISSQRFLDTETVAAKSAAADYAVTVSPAFTLAGAAYRVVLDGHHSLAAAKADGVEPAYREATGIDTDTLGMLDGTDAGAERFLEAHQLDSDWYDVDSGEGIW